MIRKADLTGRFNIPHELKLLVLKGTVVSVFESHLFHVETCQTDEMSMHEYAESLEMFFEGLVVDQSLLSLGYIREVHRDSLPSLVRIHSLVRR